MSQKKRRVLIVEDDLAVQAVLSLIVAGIDQSIEVDQVATADEGLIIIEEKRQILGQRYDLVMSDIYTPGARTGLGLWSTCHARYPELPFVVVSGAPDELFYESFKASDSIPIFLAKPFMPEECRQLIRSLLHCEQQPARGSIKDIGDLPDY